MRRGWKRFWRLGSAALIVAAIAVRSTEPARPPGSERRNELTLAGLRPGRDRITRPKAAFPALSLSRAGSDGVLEWKNGCGEKLRIELDRRHTVETITATALTREDKTGACGQAGVALESDRAFATGRGLRLGGRCEHARELYGGPESRSPSVQGPRKLELLFYSFDWAGENLPQSMEVTCDQASGRVVEITLASATL